MNNLKNITCVLAIGLTLMAQFANPFTAYADGETTPEPTDTVEVTATPDLAETTAVPEISSTPVPTEPTADPVETVSPIPPTDSTEIPTEAVDPVETTTPIPPADSTETPTESLEPAESTPEMVEPVSTEEVIEEPTVPEILQEIPEGIDIVVLDENGDPEPLATQDAAEIIATGDPIWCPDGVVPAPGTNGCSNSFGTLNELIAAIGATTNQPGTIWITSGSVGDTNPILIDGSTYTNWANHALTLQGGWSGISGDITSNGNSILTNAILNILYWNADITLNNLTKVSNAYGGGIFISTSGNVTLYNDSFTNTSGTVISNVTFNGQQGISYTTGKQTEDVTVGFNFQVWNPTPGCPGCITQLVPGLEENTPAGYCAYHGVPGGYNNGDPLTLTHGTDTYTYATLAPDTTYYLTVIHTWEYNCNNALKKYRGIAPEPIPSPPAFTPQGEGEFELNCLGKSGFAVDLPNGDLVNIFCPVTGWARIYRVDNTTLPAELPTGYFYASAYTLDIIQYNVPIPVITEGGYINASFIAQPLQPGNRYSVLYWDKDNATWVPLKDYLLDERGISQGFNLYPDLETDTRQIISGVRTNPDNGRVEVSTNFPGIFVLAQH